MNYRSVMENKSFKLGILTLLILVISNLLAFAKLYNYNRTLKEIKEDLSQTFLSEINRSITITDQFIREAKETSEFKLTTIGYLSVLQKSIGRMHSMLQILDKCFESRSGRDFSFFYVAFLLSGYEDKIYQLQALLLDEEKKINRVNEVVNQLLVLKDDLKLIRSFDISKISNRKEAKIKWEQIEKKLKFYKLQK
ncbi:hypothetical protein [Caldicellulosiruptor acetigenus]|uniref:hypothetical protein n=1 Tax=Caldicellulosiruptor acetigenus TaxID=301953 RepID=UPI0003FD3F81|nr:hypothetical protein [Caldicellulosiruptor acetigenus]WAM35435.1 hypothetical protein OTK01_001775 [Caldicellulosiruptor acetigenus]